MALEEVGVDGSHAGERDVRDVVVLRRRALDGRARRVVRDVRPRADGVHRETGEEARVGDGPDGVVRVANVRDVVDGGVGHVADGVPEGEPTPVRSGAETPVVAAPCPALLDVGGG